MNTTFLKWAGGKNWLVKNQAHRLPKQYNRYIDPFLGGGAVFFYMEPQEAIISDINSELICTYIAIQQNWEDLDRKLRFHSANHNTDYYYSIRDKRPRAITSVAARMIYLNRTCYNGIYRVNRKGKFNVPKGSKDSVINGREDFEQRSILLQGADIRCCDFEDTVEEAQMGDFLFCDPPYAIKEEERFVGYTQNLFSWEDQIRLAGALNRARGRGVKILMTNSNHPSIRSLYEEYNGFSFDEVCRYCGISSIAEARKEFSELLVTANM